MIQRCLAHVSQHRSSTGTLTAPRPCDVHVICAADVYLIVHVRADGVPVPSPVQSELWGALLGNRRDAIAISATGSGKTLGYLIPLLAKVLEEEAWKAAQGLEGGGGDDELMGANDPLLVSGFRYGCRPSALVLAPTRELALQIFTVR
jgi:superfamily II DNA/RNA helicase